MRPPQMQQRKISYAANAVHHCRRSNKTAAWAAAKRADRVVRRAMRCNRKTALADGTKLEAWAGIEPACTDLQSAEAVEISISQLFASLSRHLHSIYLARSRMFTPESVDVA